MLERRGHTVTRLEQAAEVRAILDEQPDTDFVIVLDLARPEALRFLRARVVRANIPVICVADRRKPDASSEALRLGIADLVARPVREEDLGAAISNAREFAHTAAESKPEPAPALELPAGSVFGASAAIRDVLTLVRRIAPSRCNVLVLGERGTGRESVARAVHGQSSRRERAVREGGLRDRRSLAAVARRRADSRQHRLSRRHERAAGRRAAAAARDRAPARRRAIRPTCGSSPASRRGSTTGSRAATCAPDLIEALGVVRIQLPPLRQRTEDVALLATHFLKEACRRNGIPAKAFSRSALTLLGALPWPGNTAELRLLTERLAVLVTRGVVLLEDVLANVRLEGAEALGGRSGTLREARERFERDYVATILQHHRGRMGDAARELGIERTNLYRKIKQLNIRWTTGGE